MLLKIEARDIKARVVFDKRQKINLTRQLIQDEKVIMLLFVRSTNNTSFIPHGWASK